MKINIIDDGLFAKTGHHFSWTRTISLYLREQLDHDVTIYCNKKIAADALESFGDRVEIVPHFQLSPYGARTLADDVAKQMFHFGLRFSQMVRSLANIRDADLWLFPTLTPVNLAAVAELEPSARLAGCVHRPETHLYPDIGALLWADCQKKIRKIEADITLFTTTPGLARHYRQFGGIFHALPLFFDRHESSHLEQKSNFAVPKRIGIFGSQRIEKGYFHLEELVNSLKAQGYEIIYQDTSAHKKRQPPPKGVEVLGFVDDLAAEMAKSDLVVTPYDAEQYRIAQSGIAITALSLGIPIIVPSNTHSARFSEPFSAGVVFENNGIVDILRAVERAAVDFPNLLLGAKKAQQHLLAKHGYANFINAFIS